MILVAGSAAGQTAETRQRALGEFNRGMAHMAMKQYSDACRAFDTSLSLVEGVGTLYQLGECRRALGMLALAHRHYEAAAQLARQQGRPDREKQAAQRARDLEERLTQVTILLPRLAGLELTVDDQRVPAAAQRTTLWVDPGDHQLVAAASGYRSWRTRITAVANERQAITVPPLAPASRQTTAVPESRTQRALIIAGVSLSIAGVVSLAVGTGFGALALENARAYKPGCVFGNKCTAEAVALHDAAANAAVVSNATLAAGAVALTAGAVMWGIGARLGRRNAGMRISLSSGSVELGWRF
jgi:tetratricopeptide (TPR) repeat protein